MLDYQQHILQINQKINEIQKSRLQYLNLQHISVNDEISDTYVLGDINDAESQYDKLLKETTAKAIALNGLFIMVSYVDFLCSEYAKSFKKPDINSIYDALGQVNEENDIQTFWQDCMRIYYDANQDDQAINFNDRLSHIDDKALQSINKLRHCQGLYRHPKTMMMWQQSTDEVTTYLTIRQPQVALTKDQGLSLFKGVLHTLNPYEKILLFRKIKHMDGVPQMQLSSSEFAIFFDDDDAYQTTIFLALLQNILELPLPYDRIVQQWNQLKPDEQLLFKTKIRDILGCSTFESSAFGVDEIIDRLNQSKDVIDAIIDGLKNANLLNLDVNRFLSVVLYVEHDSPPHWHTRSSPLQQHLLKRHFADLMQGRMLSSQLRNTPWPIMLNTWRSLRITIPKTFSDDERICATKIMTLAHDNYGHILDDEGIGHLLDWIIRDDRSSLESKISNVTNQERHKDEWMTRLDEYRQSYSQNEARAVAKKLKGFSTQTEVLHHGTLASFVGIKASSQLKWFIALCLMLVLGLIGVSVAYILGLTMPVGLAFSGLAACGFLGLYSGLHHRLDTWLHPLDWQASQACRHQNIDITYRPYNALKCLAKIDTKPQITSQDEPTTNEHDRQNEGYKTAKARYDKVKQEYDIAQSKSVRLFSSIRYLRNFKFASAWHGYLIVCLMGLSLPVGLLFMPTLGIALACVSLLILKLTIRLVPMDNINHDLNIKECQLTLAYQQLQSLSQSIKNHDSQWINRQISLTCASGIDRTGIAVNGLEQADTNAKIALGSWLIPGSDGGYAGILGIKKDSRFAFNAQDYAQHRTLFHSMAKWGKVRMLKLTDRIKAHHHDSITPLIADQFTPCHPVNQSDHLGRENAEADRPATPEP